MSRRIYVKAIRRSEPDIRQYVLALIALARQLQEEQGRTAESAKAVQLPSDEEPADA